MDTQLDSKTLIRNGNYEPYNSTYSSRVIYQNSDTYLKIGYQSKSEARLFAKLPPEYKKYFAEIIQSGEILHKRKTDFYVIQKRYEFPPEKQKFIHLYLYSNLVFTLRESYKLTDISIRDSGLSYNNCGITDEGEFIIFDYGV